MNYAPRWLRRFFSSILIGGQAIASIAKGKINKSDLIDQLMEAGPGSFLIVLITVSYTHLTLPTTPYV